MAVACLKSLPLDRQAALQLTAQLRRYLAFYSAATYVLHQPCPELDVLPVDINATLSDIEARIRQSPAVADPAAAAGSDGGGYTRAYDVHRDLMLLFGKIKDGHVQFLPACVAGAFLFRHNYPLVQVADRPDALPRTYVASLDPSTLMPTPGQRVLAINGREPALYLADQARSDPESSWIDPDARLNELLMHLESGEWNRGLFAARFLYPDEKLQLTLAGAGGNEQAPVNVTVQWTAQWMVSRSGSSSVFVPFTDAKSFQRTICERSDVELAALFDTVEGAPPVPTQRPPRFPPAPEGPGTTRPLLRAESARRAAKGDIDTKGVAGTKAVSKTNIEIGAVTGTATNTGRLRKRAFWPDDVEWNGNQSGEVGYYQLDAETAVLLVSAFAPTTAVSDATTLAEFAAFAGNFSEAVAQALARARAAGSKRLLVDVSGNGGGLVPLGYNLVRQLFPAPADHNRAFFGTNMRWNPALDTMLVRGDPAVIAASYMDLGLLRREDGRDWASFREMLGPVHRHGDYFSRISVPDEAEMDADVGGQVLHDFPRTPPFAADQVVLVSSGLCGSTCAIVAEALQALGVRAVTFGGRPRIGPSQAVGGVKGSQVLSFDEIFALARAFLAPTTTAAEAAATGNFSALGVKLPGPLRLRTQSARINLRNSWRRKAQFLPIEFLYTPTQWRLFYTPDMLARVAAMHDAAARVAWGGKPDVSGGPYMPVNGLDGSGFKWPDGSGGEGEGAAVGWAGGRYAVWDSLGELIWKVMRG